MVSYLEAVEAMPLESNDIIKLILEHDLFWGLGTLQDITASSHLLGFHLERLATTGDGENI